MKSSLRIGVGRSIARRELVRSRRPGTLRQRDDYRDPCPIDSGEQARFIAVEDIIWINAIGSTVLIPLADRVHAMGDALAALAERLDLRRYARLHPSAIIGVNRV